MKHKLTNLNGIEITISEETEQLGLSTLWRLMEQEADKGHNLNSAIIQDAFYVLSCVLTGTVEEKPEQELLSYAIIETLNGNYVLKEISKVKYTDNIEQELYGETIEEVQALFRAHKKELQALEKAYQPEPVLNTLKDELKYKLNIPEDNFGSHCSDLHVLYSPELEQYLKNNYEFYCNVVKELANVEGNEWYGKYFFDIPFANMP
jgi:hypothetical protein